MKTLRIKARIILVLLTGFLTACTSDEIKEDTTTKKKTEDINNVTQKDIAILSEAYTDGLYQMQLADTVKSRSTSDKTKKLAMAVSDFYSDMNAQITTLATEKKLTLPQTIGNQNMRVLNSITQQRADALDKVYIDTVISNYKSKMELYQQCGKDCKDEDIKSWFATIVPLLRQQLEQLSPGTTPVKN